MYVVSVQVHVRAERVREFIDAILDNARNTRNEPGNLRFDVLQNTKDETRFMLYEVYRSEADFKAHQQTPHYFRFKAGVDPWMAEDRVGTHYTSVFPTDDAW